MKRILFQGDSITDAGRSREDDMNRGMGYATLVTAQLGFEEPAKYEFLNRGISGNRIVDLLARIKIDMINLNPDYISILIGVNDVWHEISKENGVITEKYEMYYNMLLEELRDALPNVKIMILEPFVLKGTATEENWERFYNEVKKHAEAAKRVAIKNDVVFVPLMEKFEEALQLAPSSYWLVDGVHPTAMGHELISREWMKYFKTL